MVYCFAEALRNEARSFLKECTIIRMMRDERNGRLFLRVAGATPDLKRGAMALGISKGHGTGADAITTATMDVLTRFATPGHNCTHPGSIAKKECDADLLSHLRMGMKQVIIDAASDERLSARQMIEGMDFSKTDTFLHSDTIVTWDKAHASRRIVSRTFVAEETLGKLLGTYIFPLKNSKEQCICDLLHHSSVLADLFASFVKQAGEEDHITGIVRNLGVAKHRFNSISKRLGRFIAKIYSVFDVCEWIRIHRKRSQKEWVIAAHLLAEFSMEDYLQLAMMADASDEAYVLTLFTDREDADLALQADEVGAFIQHIEHLFLQGGCAHVVGYTQLAMKKLKEVRILNTGAGNARSFGNPDGVPQDTFDRCLKRMQRWVGLAKMVVNAEFPEFEAVAGFSMFSLMTPVQRSCVVQLSEIERASADESNMKRIAQLVGVDHAQLKAEWLDHLPLARQVFLDKGCNIFEAWREALAKTQLRRSTRIVHPGKVLRQAVIAYGAYGMSTSGVEQGFSKAYRSISLQQLGNLRVENEEDLTLVVLDTRAQGAASDLCIAARSIWCQSFGSCRTTSGKRRLDYGTTKGGPSPSSMATENTEASFLRKRRCAVAAVSSGAASYANVCLGEQAVNAGEDEPESIQKERAFNKAKLAEKRAQAYLSGQLLPEEVDEDTPS